MVVWAAMKNNLDSKIIMRLLGEVAAAAQLFESRWTMGALARVDAELAQRMAGQLADYHEAQVIGSMADLKTHVRGTVAGYKKCVRAMEASGVEDDSYIIGQDTATGFRIAIGDRRASAARVAERFGGNITWLTPDEVARLWASIAGLRRIDAIKSAFPGAEAMDIRPHTRVWPEGPHSGAWPTLAEVMPEPPPEDDDAMEVEE
jgi:hypothetical protein